MHKLILEVCDGNRGSLWEPVSLENLLDLPMGVKQAVADFIEAHDGGIATPIVITTRMEDDARFSVLGETGGDSSVNPLSETPL